MLLVQDLLALDPEARAARGVFLSFQYPVEIPGVPVMTFVRAAMNAQRKARGEAEISAPDFIKKSREIAKVLNLDPEMLKRPVNVGFSGGEKKRLEIYQMMMLEPRFMVLDETDSGLDIDALRTVAEGVNALRAPATPRSVSSTLDATRAVADGAAAPIPNPARPRPNATQMTDRPGSATASTAIDATMHHEPARTRATSPTREASRPNSGPAIENTDGRTMITRLVARAVSPNGPCSMSGASTNDPM